uniref:Uncharacterized protein n=1 Tax=Daphnia galeata TaxID=27404 RepID=A0A8J2RMN9_9CRUS|nr:unnamed protein product [Daphnia galeata]
MVLSDELLEHDNHTVLTGKMNQDPIENIIYLHTLTKTNVTSGNVDNEDELKILVGYKKFLVNRFKEIEEERKQARLSLKDKLLSI